MLLVDSLAEENILAAIRRGEFDDLPGAGEPSVLDDDSAIPAGLRVGYRILRNSGCLPPEMTLRKEISAVASLLGQVDMAAERPAIRRRLYLLRLRLAMHGQDGNLLLREQEYRTQLIAKITRDDRESARPDRRRRSAGE